MNLFNEGLKIWYYKIGIRRPLPCVYLGPIVTEPGATTYKHAIKFEPTGTIMIATESELFKGEN